MLGKKDGGLVYPGKRVETVISELGKSMENVEYPGISRRNKLIDELVAANVAGSSAQGRHGAEWTLQDLSGLIKLADEVIRLTNK